MLFSKLAQVAAVSFAAIAAAHPGEDHEHDEVAALNKRAFQYHARRSLDKCAKHLEERGLNGRAEARRKATHEKHRKRHAVRDTDSVLNTSHHSNLTGITASTPESALFAESPTCILNPDGETGPYWVKGEHIRSALREDQAGVPVIMDGQFINVETCEPIEGLYWDVWNCNATGVYSGLVATGNGDTADTSNLNTTFLRGIQQTDADGVVQFESIFPGHYSGRTNHIHMVAHVNATVLPNNTLSGGSVAHIGQIFWEQAIIDEVEATYPYNTNNITATTNAEDRVFGIETTGTDSDPVLEYALLGESVTDGLFGWITIGVNVSATYTPAYSFEYTSSGGVAVEDDSSSSGAAPSGAAPTGI